MTYTVEVTREGEAWIADVVGLAGAHTYARNLTALDTAVREVMALVLDVPEAQIPPFDYDYRGVDETFLAAASVGQKRSELAARQRDLVAETAGLAQQLSAAGWSVRDISAVLRISPGRVSQVVSEGTRSA